jgi:hypothetical protein
MWLCPFHCSICHVVLWCSMLKLLAIANMFLVLWQLSPWRWRRYAPPKRRFLQEPRGDTSQKTTFFMPTDCHRTSLAIFYIAELFKSFAVRPSRPCNTEVFTAVTMENAVFCAVSPCDSRKTLQTLQDWGFHCSDYGECRRLCCVVVWLL